MPFEVEIKYHAFDLEQVRNRLLEIGATRSGARKQSDLYLGHPQRNFAQTDEALRLRVDDGDNRVTYKGPKIDSTTKTRREIELTLLPGAPERDRWLELLVALGFRPVAEVQKQRENWHFPIDGWDVEICLDTVEQVGDFVELEVVAEESRLEDARLAVEKLGQTLGLSNRERRSYLQLLLEGQS